MTTFGGSTLLSMATSWRVPLLASHKKTPRFDAMGLLRTLAQNATRLAPPQAVVLASDGAETLPARPAANAELGGKVSLELTTLVQPDVLVERYRMAAAAGWDDSGTVNNTATVRYKA